MARVWTMAALKASAKKYKSRSEWSSGDKAAYETARKRGVLDLMIPDRRLKYNAKDLRPLVKREKVSSRTDFMTRFPGHYDYARKHGLLDELVPLKWTLESIAASAAPYKSRNAWRKGDRAGYEAARRREIISFFFDKKPSEIFWNDQTVTDLSLPFAQRSDFQRAEPYAYAYAKENKLLDLIFPRITHWNPHSDRLLTFVLGFDTAQELWEADRAAYRAAIKSGYFHKCFEDYKYDACGAVHKIAA